MGGDSYMVLPRREGTAAGTSGSGIVPLESRVRGGCVARVYRLAVELIGGWQATAIGYVSVCENVVSCPRAGSPYVGGSNAHRHRDAACTDTEV